MSPLFVPGDEVLVDPRAYRGRSPHQGEVIVARHPYMKDTSIIKRVIAVTADGRLHLAGDNPAESSDSRTFGAVSPDHVLGRVTSRFP